MFLMQNASLISRISIAVAIAAALAFVGARSRAWGSPPPPHGHEGSKQGDASKFHTDDIPAPCHPNRHAQADMATLAQRGDVRLTPQPLKERLLRLAGRPHTFLPMQTFAEADQPSLLFQYTTNWVFPLYELPNTGGIAGSFELGDIGRRSSVVPGSGPQGIRNNPLVYGDNPFLPRDPDKFDGDEDSQREFRNRSIPSGLAHEIYLDVYERLASFDPGVEFRQRLFDAYAAEVDRVDQNGDGVISSVEGDVDSASDDFADNTRLFLPATSFNRFAVTREINDGYLAPRFAPSQRAWILTGSATTVSPAVSASERRDGDDR